MIDKYRLWDSKHQRWFQGHPDEHHRNLHTDCIDLFGEIMLMGMAFKDQNNDNIWKNDKDIHSSLDILNHIQIVHCAQILDSNDYLIFEGDILKDNDRKYLVFWNDKELIWKIVDIKRFSIFDLRVLSNPTIIGNIFDNKEFENLDVFNFKELLTLPKRKT